MGGPMLNLSIQLNAIIDSTVFTYWNAVCHFQVEVANLLNLSQLAQLAATPSQLKRMQDVTKIMTVINPVDFGTFFDVVSPAIEVNLHSWQFIFEVILNIACYSP